MNIAFSGIEDLKQDEKEVLHRICGDYYPKVKRLHRDMTSVKVELKVLKKAGERRKYGVYAKSMSPARTFRSEVFDWELSPALHKAFQKIQKEMKHSFR